MAIYCVRTKFVTAVMWPVTLMLPVNIVKSRDFSSFRPPDWDSLAYQGCWKDDPDNPELPIVIPVTAGMKPSDCLAECAKNEKPDKYYFVGIQLVRLFVFLF